MKIDFQKLPLRDGVGIVVLNSKNKVFVAKRIDNPKNFWQMPQGGKDENENYFDAAVRELKEETSIKNVSLIKEIDDFIIVRSDGTPTYNFTVVVDDNDMSINHVIRGEDHISNTPKQILIYNALNYTVPNFAHLPMILGPDKKRLSKRHGAAGIEDFKIQGYSVDAPVSYTHLTLPTTPYV